MKFEHITVKMHLHCTKHNIHSITVTSKYELQMLAYE